MWKVELFEGQMLHGRAGDDASVEIPVPNLIERFVKSLKVLRRGVLGDVALRRNQLQLNLEGGVSQQTGKLNLRLDFLGHQVYQQNLQRADILRNSPPLGHDENVFPVENIHRRQVIRDFNRHKRSFPVFPDYLT